MLILYSMSAACPIRITTRLCAHSLARIAEVRAFLQKDPLVQKMLGDISRFAADWLPCFIRDNRSYLTIALGCTGGQHRSVFFAETLAAQFAGEYQVLIRHRELS